ncbi:hypothetical protein B0E33_15025 [Roseibium algicola]|uniref:Uncharacterized protein n=1 Tax=Roseibium algicola TaxID=2857014 RepID=A0ABM6I2X6_9HYPH|nr:hypothetical protein [Roseibium aggregatum]AQQ04716.1 hypothetical protein B0E33_15025 [Roseibium aggregatum]
MRYKLESLSLSQKHKLAQVGLSRMFQSRVGCRIPETHELEFGFPPCGDSIVTDAVRFLDKLRGLAPEFAITQQQIDHLRETDAKTCVEFCKRVFLETNEANLQGSEYFPEIKKRCVIYEKRLELEGQEETDCLENLVRCMELLSLNLSGVIRKIEENKGQDNQRDEDLEYLSKLSTKALLDLGSSFYEIFLIDGSLAGDASGEMIESLRNFQQIKHLGLYF